MIIYIPSIERHGSGRRLNTWLVQWIRLYMHWSEIWQVDGTASWVTLASRSPRATGADCTISILRIEMYKTVSFPAIAMLVENLFIQAIQCKDFFEDQMYVSTTGIIFSETNPSSRRNLNTTLSLNPAERSVFSRENYFCRNIHSNHRNDIKDFFVLCLCFSSLKWTVFAHCGKRCFNTQTTSCWDGRTDRLSVIAWMVRWRHWEQGCGWYRINTLTIISWLQPFVALLISLQNPNKQWQTTKTEVKPTTLAWRWVY